LPALARKPVLPQAAAQASRAPGAVPAPKVTAAAASAVAVPVCAVTSYRTPDSARPVVALTFDLSPDHRTVTGTESVSFTPDRDVTELVFRLWPNGPEGGRRDASMTVSTASSPGGLPFTTTSAGARRGTQGTLLSIPLGRTAKAGKPVQADLAFTLHLPNASWDRYGTNGTTSYWGSGFPLLAWQRGVGWTRDAASPLPGETATSEAASTSVAVTAPAADTVLAPGVGALPVPAPNNKRLWRFSADAVRDVGIVSGRLSMASSMQTVAGKPVKIVTAVAAGLPTMSNAVLQAEARRSLPALAARFGPMPFSVVRLVAVPGLVASGLEYPGMAWVLPQPDRASTRVVVAHELTHQWFYGMVGNNQARSPWLDEAFATYGESLLDGNTAAYQQPIGGDVIGRSVSSFGTDYDLYQATVYGAGTTALDQARTAVGSAAFDAAVRCYVRTNAWSIARPSDFALQLKTLPAALAVLRKAGAFS
jgi:hypothetical protein